MKTRSKLSAYILRGTTTALLFSCVIVALCSAINLSEQSPNARSARGNAVFSANGHESRSLSFAERVAYQRAIEDVYWRHRIWPNTNPGPKPALDAVISQAQLEKKVEDYLRNSQAQDDYGHQPITAEQLQAEMDRMAQHTKQPEVLRELFAALGNDPFVIAECLARPVVSERLIADLSGQHQTRRLESVRAAETQMPKKAAAIDSIAQAVQANHSYQLPVIAGLSSRCIDDSWTATSTTNAPTARQSHTAVWTGTEMIVWGGQDTSGLVLHTGGRYNPSTDSWTATSTTNSPTGRRLHTAVWTGSEMIVWGGLNFSGNGLGTGGKYNPSTDSWTATTDNNAPFQRCLHTAVWTGTEMIVWSGQMTHGGYLNTGGRYNPNMDSWTATSTTNAPTGRWGHTAVWSGSEMIVWGGFDNDWQNTGGRYNPNTDSWTATSTTNAPSQRLLHTAVWTGSEMIVWGGDSFYIALNTGGRYNPSTDSWTATSTTNAPTDRIRHTAVWTASEMIVWGGYNNCAPNCQYLNTGGRYNPGTDSWTATSTTDVPDARYGHTAVWTDNEMIVWGGSIVGSVANTGGRYCAQAGGPITLSATGRKIGGINTVRLTWSGATSANIDVYRNGALIVTTPNNGSYTDSTGDTGRARYTYRVCEAGSTTCSNDARVGFRQ